MLKPKYLFNILKKLYCRKLEHFKRNKNFETHKQNVDFIVLVLNYSLEKNIKVAKYYVARSPTLHHFTSNTVRRRRRRARTCGVSKMLALVVIVLTIALVLFAIYQKNTHAICKSNKNLGGKTVLVTGGTSGMGLEVAMDLAYRDAKVIIACPFLEEGERARKMIVENTGNEKTVFKHLDLASLESVRNFAKDILNNEDRLDILFNNAGVGVIGDVHTNDGINLILQINYFGHFLLTLLLLPLLRKTGTALEPARIVNTSSLTHWIGKFHVDNFNKTGYWFKLQLYANSKLFLILFSRELTRRLKDSNVVINNVSPGYVATRIYYSAGRLLGFICNLLITIFFKTPRLGAQTSLYVALSPKAGRVSGEYFANCSLTWTAGHARCDQSAARLWEESVKLVKLSDQELSNCFK